MATRYFIFLSYKGSAYHGWQVQPNSITIQQILERSLSLLFGEQISTTGAGRTDAGVHAAFFCAHFDSNSENLDNDKDILFKINRFLPKDIAVSAIRKVRPDANARFNALSRTYKYYITRVKDPFKEDYSWFIYGNIDIEKMNQASEELMKHNDFTSFSRLHTDVKTNNCTIYHANWSLDKSMLTYTITADRFLRNMVRAIVGTMIDAGQGKISIDEFRDIIVARNRSFAGTSAPAKGLFLTDIQYPPELYL